MITASTLAQPLHRSLAAFLTLALALCLSACDAGTPVDPNEGRPTFAEVAGATGAPDAKAGDTVHVEAGATVEVAVRLLDARREPVAGWEVIFTPDANSAVDDTLAVTGSDGIARAAWTVGDAPGTYALDVAAARTRSSVGPVSPIDSWGGTADLFATVPTDAASAQSQPVRSE